MLQSLTGQAAIYVVETSKKVAAFQFLIAPQKQVLGNSWDIMYTDIWTWFALRETLGD